MNTRELTCIVCPRGCRISVRLGPSGAPEEISGYSCPRGLEYAKSECTHPMRTVTSTVVTPDGGVVPVKTSAPVPKEDIAAVMTAIKSATAPLPVHIGDVLIKNVCGTGADILATDSRE